MSSVNKAIIIGNLGKDPELQYTQSGVPVCKFSVATSENWKDKNTGEKKEKTTWHNIVLFAGLADIAAKYLNKWAKVYIEGKIDNRSYEKDGITKYISEVIAEKMTMLGGGQSRDNNQSHGYQQPDYGSYPPPAGEDDDLPF